jgi:membrane-associated protein
MDWLAQFWDTIIHLDQHLKVVIQDYGSLTYGLLFLIVFLETGIVIFPFLPGDTLLFTAGLLADDGGLNLGYLMILFPTAALCGDLTNYTIGKFIGPRLFKNPKSRMLNPKNLEKTHAFMEKYGPKAIIIARFVPIVRTMCPFVAGMGYMTFGKFFRYSVIGAIVWTVVCVGAGYLFGRMIPSGNFAYAILGIIAVTLIPIAIEYLRHRRNAKREAAATESPN